MHSTSTQGGKNNMPKDSQIIVSMMEDLGIVEYDQQVLNHFLEFNHRYTTQLLEDAKALSNSAKKKSVDADDVKLAIQMAQNGVFPRPPPLKVLMTAANEVNQMPLPPPISASQIRIPHDSPNFVKTKYRLRYESPVCYGENKRKANKITAAEMLAESRRLQNEHTPVPQSSQMKNSLKAELRETIEDRRSSHESARENDKDEIMDA
ncbi:uncharacterized protein LOC132946631 [Metopolophium dirhodum]|uniref:uncharacterized protein LOC132946631 n=1 Tax=Metopolophium dirhodum TaxID=44670 RepID=UPI0029904855|nr:uncharacterized protein LOC132946631 [Metopolophium dirhodum]